MTGQTGSTPGPSSSDTELLALVLEHQQALLVEDADDELLIFKPDHEDTIYLNGSAALIFRLLDGQRSGTDIAGLLQEGYPEAGEHILTDIADSLRAFLSSDIVRPATQTTDL